MAQLSTPEPVWQGRSQSAPKRAIAGDALDTNGPFYKVTAGTYPLPTALAPQVQVLGVTVQLVTILALDHRNVPCSSTCMHMQHTNTRASDRNDAIHPHAKADIINTHKHKHTHVISMSTYNTYPPRSIHIQYTRACICDTYLYI